MSYLLIRAIRHAGGMEFSRPNAIPSGLYDKHTRCYCTTQENQTVVSPPTTRCFRDIPGPSGLYDIPYLGMSFHFKPFGKHSVEKASKLFLELRNKYGYIMKQRIGAEHYVFLFDPEDFELVFKADGPYPFREELHIVTTYCRRNNKPIGLNGLNGEAWSLLRKPTQDKMLRPSVVSRFLPIINQITDDLIDLINANPEQKDINKVMLNYALENAGALAFNKRLGLLDNDTSSERLRQDFADFFKMLSEHFFLPPLYKYFPTPFYRKFEQAANGIYGRFEAELDSVKSSLEGTVDGDDIPNLAVELLKDDRITSDGQVRSVLLDIFIAGGDTTSSTLSGIIYNVAKRPEVQQKLYEEVEQITSGHSGVEESDLKKLSYLKSCVKESLRYLYPLPVGIARRTVKDLVIKGYEIPKNTYIIMGFNQVCGDPAVFTDPDLFLPERWERGSQLKVKNPFAFLPFSFGTRSCLGQRFAEQEIHVLLAKLIKQFEFSIPADMMEIDYVHKLFIYPEKPVTVIFKPRRTH